MLVRFLWEGLGYSPQQIARIKRLITEAPPASAHGTERGGEVITQVDQMATPSGSAST